MSRSKAPSSFTLYLSYMSFNNRGTSEEVSLAKSLAHLLRKVINLVPLEFNLLMFVDIIHRTTIKNAWHCLDTCQGVVYLLNFCNLLRH